MISSSKKVADVVIIGSGVIGCSISLELCRAGFRVLNVDKEGQAGAGSTSYSSGICRMMYSIRDSVMFAWEGMTYYENWADHVKLPSDEPLATLKMSGALIFRAAESKKYLNNVMKAYDTVPGLDYEEWSLNKIQDTYPMLDLTEFGPPVRIDNERFGESVSNRNVESGVWFPRTGYVSDPQLAARNLQSAAIATGQSEFIFNREVISVNRTSSRVSGVTLDDGSILEAPVVVNVAGPHSSHVTRMAFPDPKENDMNIHTHALRQEVSYVPAPKTWKKNEFNAVLPVCSDVDLGIYYRPDVGEKILIGTTEPECDVNHLIKPENPDDVKPGGFLSSLTDQWTNQVYRAALRMPTMPLPDSTSTQGIVACYDVTPDWTPIYDKTSLPGYYMAIGTSGNQFKNAGVAGRLMREIIEITENGDVDLDKHPLQFKLNRIPGGGVVNTSSFSRRRDVLDTSASVLG